jgi:hypothetical protein
MPFYHPLVTEKSLQILKDFRKKYKFILIGGWAVFFYTKALKSKDIDLILEYQDLEKLGQEFSITKNQRLRKYEVKIEEVDIDIYLPHYSNPGLPVEGIKKYTTQRESFILPIPEVLLILKQNVYRQRKDSLKGQKDKIDIFSLLKSIEIDWKLYRKILKRYRQEGLRQELIELLNTTSEIKEVNLNQHLLSKLKKRLLKKI